MAVREIKARIGAMRMLMQGTMSDDAKAAISTMQANAVVAAIIKHKGVLTADDVSDIGNFAAATPWAEGDREKVLAVLVDISHEQAPKKRRNQQDFKQFVNYFKDAEWAAFETSSNKEGVLRDIISRVWALGCRTPNEQSLKAMNSAWAVLTHTEDPCAYIIDLVPCR